MEELNEKIMNELFATDQRLHTAGEQEMDSHIATLEELKRRVLALSPTMCIGVYVHSHNHLDPHTAYGSV